MGIRFRCPKGHKIHVKAYLAGKRGICPECGLKVPIPPQSDPEFADKVQKKRPVRAHPQPGAPAGTPNRATGATATRPTPVPDRSGSPSSNHPADKPSPAATPKNATRPEATAEAAVRPAAPRETEVDPIAAAPQAKWFVRPPSGGQFGPAPGSVLRNWMAEGRVTEESYIWREGWPEWRKADQVFGPFVSTSATAAGDSIPEIVTYTATTSTSELYRRKKSTKMTVTIVALLGLACAVLFAALLYVVRFMK